MPTMHKGEDDSCSISPRDGGGPTEFVDGADALTLDVTLGALFSIPG